MISAFGKCVKKIRGEESLRTMASRLGISPSFLSAMEVGRKTIPMEYCDKIRDEYKITDEQYAELFDAIAETNGHVDIEIAKMEEAKKNTSLVFARKIESADPELVERLRKVLLEEE